MTEEQREECEEMIDEIGISFWCEDCGTELDIFESECGECGEATHGDTDCQVADVRERLDELGYTTSEGE